MKKLIPIFILLLAVSCGTLQENAPEKPQNYYDQRFLECYDVAFRINTNHQQSLELCEKALGKRL